MRHKRITIFLALVIGVGCASLLVGVVAHQAQAMPIWQQANLDGFGNPNNQQIPSLAVFGDYLYAGVWDWDGITTTAQVWRSQTGLNWEMVDDRPLNGVGAMMAFNGSIYAGSWDGHIWSSPDGLAWTEVITDGFNGSHQAISTFSVYADALYATTWWSGTEIWRTTDGEHWLPFVEDGLGDLNNTGIPASESWLGQLYFGVANHITGAQVWRTDGITVTPVITDGFGITTNKSVSALHYFGNLLYASVWNDLEGVKVYRTPTGETWEQVMARAGDPFNWEVSALEVYHDQLYLVVGYSDGLQVWRTANGTFWEQVGFAGFGDANNQWSYWDNATTVFKDKLYVGTNNFASGGEIWQMTAENSKTFLPFSAKPCPPLYYDDFSDPATGWPIGDYNNAHYNYINGEYQVITKIPGERHGAIGDMGVSGFIAELDARPASHLDGAVGLTFNWVAPGQYYLFEISDGQYSLWRFEPAQRVTLVDWTSSPAINPRYMSNHFKVVRDGASIKIYANNQLLDTVSDSTYFGTYVGMSSEAFETPNYDGRFDNLAVYSVSGCGGTKLSSVTPSRSWLDQGVSSPEP